MLYPQILSKSQSSSMPLLIKPPTSPSNSVISKLIAENLKQKAENALLILYCSRLENHMKVAESTSTSSSLQSLIALKQQVLFNRLDICEKVVSEILPALRLEDYKIKEKEFILIDCQIICLWQQEWHVSLQMVLKQSTRREKQQ